MLYAECECYLMCLCGPRVVSRVLSGVCGFVMLCLLYVWRGRVWFWVNVFVCCVCDVLCDGAWFVFVCFVCLRGCVVYCACVLSRWVIGWCCMCLLCVLFLCLCAVFV